MTREQPKNTTYGAASFTLATGQTNSNVRTTTPALFNDFVSGRFLRISTDQTITLRFNSTSNAGIIMTATESPREFTRQDEGLVISDIFITNASGSTANIKAELYQ